MIERLAAPSADGASAWGDAIIADRAVDAKDGYQGIDGIRYGLAGGFEYGLGGTTKVGVGAVYAKDAIDLDATPSEAKIDTASVFAYGGFDFGRAALRVGGGYSWVNVDTRRRVGIGSLQDDLRSKQDGTQWQAFGELAYAAPVGAMTVEPFASVAFARTKFEAADEGGSAAALQVAAQSQETTVGRAGARLSGPLFDLGKTPLAIDAEIAGERYFGSDRASRSVTFASTGQSFTVGANDLGQEILRLRLGATTAAMGGEFGFGFVGALSSDEKDYGFRLRARWDF